MDIRDLISQDTVIFDATLSTKEDLFTNIANTLHSLGVVTKPNKFMKDLYKREKETSTGIEDEFGIPHAKSKYVTRPTLMFYNTNGVEDYKALDDTTVKYAFVIAVPKSGSNVHLEILSQLARKLMDSEFRNKLKSAETPQQVLDILNTF